MKKIILLLLLSVGSIAFSQTTLDEYNYLTKGYSIQKSAGLDMKTGYRLEHLFDYTKDTYSFSYSVFYTNEKLSAVLIEANSSTMFGINQYYICLPFGSDFMSLYDNKMNEFDKDFLRAYNSGLSRLFSNVLYNGLIAEMSKNDVKQTVKPKLNPKKK